MAKAKKKTCEKKGCRKVAQEKCATLDHTSDGFDEADDLCQIHTDERVLEILKSRLAANGMWALNKFLADRDDRAD
jgi:hypothetical protein